MPFPINLCCDLILGCAVSHLSRPSKAFQEAWLSWPLLSLLAFQALVVTPMASFLLRFYSDWSFFYYLDGNIQQTLGALMFQHIIYTSLGAVALLWFVALVGYTLTRYGILHQHMLLQRLPTAFGLVATALLTACTLPRILYLGDATSFWLQQADFLWLQAAGWLGSAMYGCGWGYLYLLKKYVSQTDLHFFNLKSLSKDG